MPQHHGQGSLRCPPPPGPPSGRLDAVIVAEEATDGQRDQYTHRPLARAEAARYVAEGYWAGVPIGALLREVADRTPAAERWWIPGPG